MLLAVAFFREIKPRTWHVIPRAADRRQCDPRFPERRRVRVRQGAEDRLLEHGRPRITGWESADVVGRRCLDGVLCHIDNNGHQLCGEEFCPLHRAMVTGTQSTVGIIVFAQGKKGNRIPMQVTVSSDPRRGGGNHRRGRDVPRRVGVAGGPGAGEENPGPLVGNGPRPQTRASASRRITSRTTSSAAITTPSNNWTGIITGSCWPT